MCVELSHQVWLELLPLFFHMDIYRYTGENYFLENLYSKTTLAFVLKTSEIEKLKMLKTKMGMSNG